jgi:hypothetical protein
MQQLAGALERTLTPRPPLEHASSRLYLVRRGFDLIDLAAICRLAHRSGDQANPLNNADSATNCTDEDTSAADRGPAPSCDHVRSASALMMQ